LKPKQEGFAVLRETETLDVEYRLQTGQMEVSNADKKSKKGNRSLNRPWRPTGL
jgi:hypothetical protein